MSAPVNPNMVATFAPPVMEARRWIEGVAFAADRPLINVSQAAPMEPPPRALREAIAEMAVNDTEAHLYGPVLGLPELRAEIAGCWSRDYAGMIAPEQVAITSGCNQAFTAVMTTLAAPGDDVLIPTPWYFNHKMHLDMAGVRAIPLATHRDMLPDPGEAEALIGPRTRAIVLVSPNNPAGAEYPADLIAGFAQVARRHGLALVLDETYRDFDSRAVPPHPLFRDPDWHETLIHLYSFSKAFRLTGHRVGAVIAGVDRLRELEKYLDTVTICPNQIGQRAALWGLRNLRQWLAGEREEILARRAAVRDRFGTLSASGWTLKGLGAYFAYLEHPFTPSSGDLAPLLVRSAGVLMLPGTMFRPEDDPLGPREFRIAFANVDADGIASLFKRLENIPPDLAPLAEGA